MAYRIQYGGYEFRFPERFLPNFGQTSPVIAQLMDRDGGVFVAGRGPERVTMAQIPFSFSLRAQTPDLMFAERNRVTLLQGEDEQQLMVTPSGQTTGLRCLAKITQLTIGHDGRSTSELISECQCVFTVADPRWRRSHFTAPIYLDGTRTLSQTPSVTLAGPAGSRFTRTISTTDRVHVYTWNNAGTTVAYPNVSVLNTAAGNKPALTVRRLAQGATEDAVRIGRYSQELLQFDGGLGYVALDGRGRAGRAATRFLHPGMLRLQPGDNTIAFEFASSPNGAVISARWDDAWR